MVEPIFRQENDAFRFVAEIGVVHIHDKKRGTVASYPVADQTGGAKPMFDAPKALGMAEFDSMWAQAKLSGTIYVEKVISGGQTGADRGGLEAAIELGIPHGGFCPKGRKSEDGPIPEKYQLEETPSPSYV
ncbi:MAG TPA: putative molybdenum carrier protein, partial [Chloroflexota bacterium]|nr:putative molybdenum carrier protein [Chloroflexota bacterium]